MCPVSQAHTHAWIEQQIARLSVQDGAPVLDASGWVSAWLAGETVHVEGATLGYTAMCLATAMHQAPRDKPLRWMCVLPSEEKAERMAQCLRFHLQHSSRREQDGQEGLAVPVLEMIESDSPFKKVIADKRLMMDRMAVIHQADIRNQWIMVVTPETLLKRFPSTTRVARYTQRVEHDGVLERDKFLGFLVKTGYTKVPVVEDPGTFAVRGSMLDVFSPDASYPVRIELDDYVVHRLDLFEPETQRRIEAIQSYRVMPASERLLESHELEKIANRLRDLCDHQEMPTRLAKEWCAARLEELQSGLGLNEGLWQAVLPEGGGLLELFTDAFVLSFGGVEVRERLSFADVQWREEHAIQKEESPMFEFNASVCPLDRILELLEAKQRGTVEPTARLKPEELRDGLGAERTHKVLVEPHDVLAMHLKQARLSRNEKPHEALDQALAVWSEHGLKIQMVAKTDLQSDRIKHLLSETAVKVEFVLGKLPEGYISLVDRKVVLSEEEVFGSRQERKRRVTRNVNRHFRDGSAIELGQLEVGDVVVHAAHGVARYLGLESKTLGLSKDEAYRGIKPQTIEVLCLEYADGKVYLPVTALAHLHLYSTKDQKPPKFDKIKTKSFERTKEKVKAQAKKMADELLHLYAKRKALLRDPLPPSGALYEAFEATFPFEETVDQAQAIEDVLSDCLGEHPMDRIICGDVGFGKTEVAMRAAFRMVEAGKQVALLCPTTVLAQQHFHTFQSRLGEHGAKVEVLSRFVDKKKQEEVLANTKLGQVDVLVGTHRLLSKDIHFKQLGLLVIDEEQRFGVAHKERLKQYRQEVDVLTLTATPIPRTLQMAVGGLREMSLIQTAPTDRRSVRTLLCQWDVILFKEAIERELKRGGQVFLVHPRIEQLYARATEISLWNKKWRVGVVHGQLSETSVENTMADFVEGKLDVLCATSIIESGIDIPRANTMIIDRADSFGMAQLYQLRGRVGRSKERAYCFLVTPAPNRLTEEAKSRLAAMVRFSSLGSGVQISSLDAEIRGSGDVLGSEQSGQVALVGFELFMQMLHEAVADLKGETLESKIETEITVSIEHYIPESYVESVGERLVYYKKLSTVDTAEQVEEYAEEMKDKYGEPPESVLALLKISQLRPGLRYLRILGCEATSDRVTLHMDTETPISSEGLVGWVNKPKSPWTIGADMKLIKQCDQGDPLIHIQNTVKQLMTLCVSAVATGIPLDPRPSNSSPLNGGQLRLSFPDDHRKK